MPQIFISYRRSDSQIITGRIYDQLELAFGADSIFKDVDNIPPGEDFRRVLREAVAWCQVMLVIIGPDWLSEHDQDGNRRIDDPADFVRLEIRSGMERGGLTVVPVLVMNARMPTADRLPIDLRELAFLNAIEIRNDPDFRRDMQKLVNRIREIDEQHKAAATPGQPSRSQSAGRRNILIGGIGLVLVALIVAGVLFLGGDGSSNGDDRATEQAASSATQQVINDSTATMNALDFTATQSAVNQTATQSAFDIVSTQSIVDATATQNALDFGATQNSVDETATQNAEIAVATLEAMNADSTATAQAFENTTATQIAENSTATQQVLDATLVALAATQTAAARPTETPTLTPTLTATPTYTATPSPTQLVGTSNLILYYDRVSGTTILGQLTDDGDYVDAASPITIPTGYTHVVGVGNQRALFYNMNNNTGEVRQFRADGTSSQLWITDTFSHWTHIVENNGHVLFYDCESVDGFVGLLTYVDGNGNLVFLSDRYTQGDIQADGCPTNVADTVIAGTNDWYIIYNSSGQYVVIQLNPDGTINNRGRNSSGGLSPGWTHIVGYNGQLVFYNQETSAAAYGTFVDGTFLQRLGYSSDDRFESGWTHIVAIDDRLLFYNANDRHGEVGRFNSDGSYTVLDANLRMSGWTNITVLH